MKIGVFICHCGANIAGVIDIEKIKENLKDDPDLFVFDNPYSCSEAGLLDLKKAIEEYNLDRIVVAACSPKMHEKLFRDMLAEVNINPFLLDIANIREQDSWVHRSQPEAATIKALDLIKMAIEKVKNLEPLSKIKIPVNNKALVIGGGIGGISASLNLANMGIKVYLVEKEPSIGGHMAQYDKTFPTLDCSICILAPLMVEASLHPNIEILTYCEVEEVKGHIGDFEVTILKKPRFVDPTKCISGCIEDCSKNCPIKVPDPFNKFGSHKAIYIPFPQAVPLMATINKDYCIGCRNCQFFCKREAIDFNQKPEKINIKVGTIIVSTGFDVYNASNSPEYGYSQYLNVITGLEMERILTPFGPTQGKLIRPSDGKPIKSVAFIQCVGSRDESIGRPHCSRVCCMYSIKQASQIKEKIPDAEITILYIDIRSYGKGYEEFYKRSLEEHIRYIKGKPSKVVEDPITKNLIIKTEDALIGRQIEIEADLVVLAVGMDPADDIEKVAVILNISRSEDGFFQESHPKLRPEESIFPGIFLAGCAQGPKDIQDTISHANAAALKAGTILQKKEILIDPIAPKIDYKRCTNCKLCIWVCDSNAIEFKEDKIVINEAGCLGCGACAAACPVSALSLPNFTEQQILAQIRALKKTDYPYIIGFFCNWCAYGAADLAGTSKIEYPSNVRIIRVMCAGNVSPSYIIEAFDNGADGVLIAGCYEHDCHYRTGFGKATKRVIVLKDLLEQIGINSKRLRIESASASEGIKIKEIVEDFVRQLEELGPLGSEIKNIDIEQDIKGEKGEGLENE